MHAAQSQSWKALSRQAHHLCHEVKPSKGVQVRLQLEKEKKKKQKATFRNMELDKSMNQAE